MMLRLLPCYEGVSYEGELTPFHPLHGDMDGDALYLFLVSLSRYGDPDFRSDDLAAIAARLLSREGAVLAGGLVAVKDAFRLFPGCCCGLEGWREWRFVVPGDHNGLWLGHDPSPWVDTTGPVAILHPDEGDDETLAVPYAEVGEALARAGRDLEDFLAVLALWLKAEGIADSPRLVARIGEWFRIGDAHAPDA
jgi:hypothetical protein